MKRFFGAVIGLALVIGVLNTLGREAKAEDQLIGVIMSTDGGSVCNWSTGVGSPGCNPGEACGAAFNLPSGQKLVSVTCDQNAYFSVSRVGVDAGTGMPCFANVPFFTDTGKLISTTKPDGGPYIGASICVVGATAKIQTRTGLE